jgi:hypothetical protein
VSIKEEFEKAFEKECNGPWSLMIGDQLAVAQTKRSALWAAKWMADRCAKEINYQALEEKFISLPSHAKNNTVAIDNLIGCVIRERVEKIHELEKELE